MQSLSIVCCPCIRHWHQQRHRPRPLSNNNNNNNSAGAPAQAVCLSHFTISPFRILIFTFYDSPFQFNFYAPCCTSAPPPAAPAKYTWLLLSVRLVCVCMCMYVFVYFCFASMFLYSALQLFKKERWIFFKRYISAGSNCSCSCSYSGTFVLSIFSITFGRWFGGPWQVCSTNRSRWQPSAERCRCPL